jgi:hypothetical protein
MSDKNLRDMPMDELQKLLSACQKNLSLSQLYRQGTDVVARNKNQLEKIQKAIVDKGGQPLSSK